MIINSLKNTNINPVRIKTNQHKEVSFNGSADTFVKSTRAQEVIEDLLINTTPKDWKKPVFNFDRRVVESRYLKHPEYGKVTVKILLRNNAIERGFKGYSPSYHQAVVSIPKAGKKEVSTDIKSDVFKLAIKVTEIGDKLIVPLDPANPPKGGSAIN
ncbi:MAG: hypothetical protein AB1782_20450 [Cyanobacteriota bacterium]